MVTILSQPWQQADIPTISFIISHFAQLGKGLSRFAGFSFVGGRRREALTGNPFW
jgi:hypothetical protein